MNIHIGPDLPIGCGLHADRLENLYRTSYPLLAYLNPWGGELVVIVQDGHILGIVRRDKRSIWQKIVERVRQYFNQRFLKKENVEEESVPPSLVDCCT